MLSHVPQDDPIQLTFLGLRVSFSRSLPCRRPSPHVECRREPTGVNGSQRERNSKQPLKSCLANALPQFFNGGMKLKHLALAVCISQLLALGITLFDIIDVIMVTGNQYSSGLGTRMVVRSALYFILSIPLPLFFLYVWKKSK
jgi:hypothetical protein